ncbi:hypothetical protein C2E23DRAFT_820150 [Lenzites betulinus]|nr:hypothetical protein C2E23DRAFT_820150 [Lenzites betulinus]
MNFEKTSTGTPPARVLAEMRKMIPLGRDRTPNMDLQWLRVRITITDSLTNTLALGVFTVITFAVLYTIRSKKYRDGLVSAVLLFVVSDFVTCFITWLGMISRLIETFGVLAAEISTSVTLLRDVLALSCSDCLNDPQCRSPYPTSRLDSQPPYTGHGCVGSALAATDTVLHAAVLVGCVAFTYLPPKQLRLGVALGVVLCAPFLVACASAVKHVRGICWPELYDFSASTPSTREWGVSDARPLDAFSVKLLSYSRTIAKLLAVYHLWESRDSIGRYLRTQTDFVRTMFIVYGVPAIVTMGWRTFRRAYATEWHVERPALKYALISAGDALIIPLMNMYPGLVLIAQRVRSSNAESEKAVSVDAEKLEVPGPIPDLPLGEKGEPVESAEAPST